MARGIFFERTRGVKYLYEHCGQKGEGLCNGVTFTVMTNTGAASNSIADIIQNEKI